jgi:hypothetical protein
MDQRGGIRGTIRACAQGRQRCQKNPESVVLHHFFA